MLSKILSILIQELRGIRYRLLSTCCSVEGRPRRAQPVLLHGKGQIIFGKKCKFGYRFSPGFYDKITYIEARKAGSMVRFSDNVRVNNGCSFISEGDGIEIGADTLIGMNCLIMDSDGHALKAEERSNSSFVATSKVSIGKNVFIGANVVILKGVTVGDGAVIAAGSIVTSDLEGGTIHGGAPARLIRKL